MEAILKRFAAQKQANIGLSVEAKKSTIVAADYEKPCDAPKDDEPISSSEIRKYLEKFEENKMEQTPDSITFDCIQSFVAWYELNREKFSEKQRAPFETLVTARNQINLGCSCRAHVRQNMANDYYKVFFINNQKTDMIPTIKSVAGVNTIIFKIVTQEFLRI
jgi:hypothetical protein